MLQIGKDWRALIGNACWSWNLGYIPMIFKAISIATTNYSFDGTYILSQETGLITKKTTNVDLRRAKMINATDSPLSGGSITSVENNGRSYQFPYIKHAREIA